MSYYSEVSRNNQTDDNYRRISEKPSNDGRYLVKFYNKFMPEYDCIELVYREFKDGSWIEPFYNYENDGYELIGWYEK